MYISYLMVKYYLRDVLSGWYCYRDVPPDEIEDYQELVLQMKIRATKKGDLESLRLGLLYILNRNDIDCRQLNDGLYPYFEEEVREILCYSYRVIWPDIPLVITGEEVSDIDLVPIALEDWWKERDARDIKLNLMPV